MLKTIYVVLALVSLTLAQDQPQTPNSALDTLIAHKPTPKQAPDQEVTAAVATLSDALKDPAKADSALRARIESLIAARGQDLVPTKARPTTDRDPLARVLVAYEARRLAATPVSEIRPFNAEFPGWIAPDTATVERHVSIDCRVPGRHSLGLYAAPGAVISASAEPAIPGLKIRIGAHSDNITKRPFWPRMPEITRTFPIDRDNAKAANAFGGLVYIEVPANCKVNETRITIGGAVEAPYFELNTTPLDTWKKSREAIGPWAELATAKVILTVPSESIRTLDDPRPVLEFWDRILDAAADLATIPHDRSRPERYVADIEISAGYMHSGYPIMTHLDAAKSMVDLEAMQKGQWGLFHELGHNHQQRDWTFDGTTEVTCNLFSMYIIEEVCGKPKGSGHEALTKAHDKVKAMLAANIKPWGFAPSDADKAAGAGDPFTRLVMYRQLIDAFGWEPFKKVFAEYRALDKDAHPKTEDDRRDQWMVRMSKTVGKNLGPFFDAWGVPTSETARESIRDLKAWMPEGW